MAWSRQQHEHRNRRLRASALALCAAAGACAATRTELAHSEVVTPLQAPLRNVLVLAMSSHPDVRELLEKELTERLRRTGIYAAGASTYLDLAGAPPSRESVRAILDREEFDGLVVLRLASRGTRYRTEYASRLAHPFFAPLGFYDYYPRAWPYVYAPTYLVGEPLAAVEARVYGTDDAARLVFRATSEDFDRSALAAAAPDVAAELVERLHEAGFVPPRPP